MANSVQEIESTSPYIRTEKMAKITITEACYMPLTAFRKTADHVLQMWIKADANKTVQLMIDATAVESISVTSSWLEYKKLLLNMQKDAEMILSFPVGTYYIYHAQIEEGNKATTWQIAPEDTEEEIDDVRKRVTTSETQISQTKDEISLMARKVEDTANGVSEAKAELTIQADEISSKVSKNGVISSINQSAEAISINASKVNLTGYVTFVGLADGSTTIDGGCLKTGTIIANNGVYELNMSTGKIKMKDAEITGGSINIETSSASQDKIALTYGAKNVSVAPGHVNVYTSGYGSEITSDRVKSPSFAIGSSTEARTYNKWDENGLECTMKPSVTGSITSAANAYTYGSNGLYLTEGSYIVTANVSFGSANSSGQTINQEQLFLFSALASSSTAEIKSAIAKYGAETWRSGCHCNLVACVKILVTANRYIKIGQFSDVAGCVTNYSISAMRIG